MQSAHVLCCGGAGYIGSHTIIYLIGAGYKVSVLDNLTNSTNECLKRLEEITGQKIPFFNIDICDRQAMKKLFAENKIDAVVDFAALKAVGESFEKPLDYYDVNINGLVGLLKVMRDAGCKNLVYSSSATVYLPSEKLLKEDAPLGASNPYGRTKLYAEKMLEDVYNSDKSWNISILRYFNPVGSHPSGRIGEAPETPMNILPIIQQVAIGRIPAVTVCGNDYDTPDGTGVRDYIHVEDLAEGHVAALKKMIPQKGCFWIHNLGAGKGFSVMELIKLFEDACGKTIPYKVTARRPGDLASVVCDPSKAQKDLDWKTTRTIKQACESAWKWQSQNPNGYKVKA